MPPSEFSFNSITHELFRLPGVLRRGDVLDVGSKEGLWACMYACWAPERTIHAVDPSEAELGSRQYRCAKSVRTHNAAVSDVDGWLHANASQTAWLSTKDGMPGLTLGEDPGEGIGRQTDMPVPVRRIDRLFAEWDAHLAFAHIDVEGFERNAVLGMRAVIARDRPVFSTELFASRPDAKALLQTIAALNYSSFLIQEQCGMHFDCRNVLSFPNERLELLLDSPALDVAARSSRIVTVDAETVGAYRNVQTIASDHARCTSSWFCFHRFANVVEWLPARLRDAWNKKDHHLQIGAKVADVRADALKAVEKHRLAAEGRDVRLAEKHRKK